MIARIFQRYKKIKNFINKCSWRCGICRTRSCLLNNKYGKAIGILNWWNNKHCC